MFQTDITIIFPIYHSAKFIEGSVQRVIQACRSHKIFAEILLCDDGGKDQSGRILKQISSQYPEVKVFYNGRNRGFGFTLRKLIKHSSAERIIYCDIDLPFGEDGVFAVVRELDNNDIVVASRYKGIKNYVGFSRKIFSRLYWLLCRSILKIPVKDIGSGTVAFLRSKVQELSLQSDGFEVHTELYIKAFKKKFRIKEIALPSEKENNGSFSVFRHGPAIFKNTFRLWLALR